MLLRLFGTLFILSSLANGFVLVIASIAIFHQFSGPEGHKIPQDQWATTFGMLAGRWMGALLILGLGIWMWRRSLRKPTSVEGAPVLPPPVPGSAEPSSPSSSAPAPASVAASMPAVSTQAKNRQWSACNIVQVSDGGGRLWQFEARGGGFNLVREQKLASTETLPARHVAKSWSSLWQPKLNVAWLPSEEIFLRVVELPKSNFEETRSMVELQLEKLSPLPVGQVVWTIHVLPSSSADLQSVVVVIASRAAVEQFLGDLEGRGFLPDRLETPLLDELSAAPPAGDGAWIYAGTHGGNSALVAWWFGGSLRNLSYLILPANGDSVKSLREQLAQISWAGELEGWLTGSPQWLLVAEPAIASQWENFLRDALGEPVQVFNPPAPMELAANTARRASTAADTGLLPGEFSERYRQEFHDRLWLHGLYTAGVVYAIAVVIYFAATWVLSLQTKKVEQQVAGISESYTNLMELQARYNVLKERDQLKYAALDCWKLVAEQLPDKITLQRFSFSGGQRLSLSGTTTQDQFDTLLNFNTAMQKVTLNGKPMFDPRGSESVNPHPGPNNILNWSFTLQLANTEKPQ